MQHHANPSARDAAPRDATADLLLAATRRLADADQPTREEADLYREAFYSSIHRLDTATRQTVATLLSRTPFCPRPIALFLAMDVPAVAHSMLRHSAVLGERDLLQILSKTTPIHVRLLAARAHLSDELIERIAAHDDADIHAALLANSTLSLDDAMRARLTPAEPGRLRRTVRTVARAKPIAAPKATPVGTARLTQALANTRPGRTSQQVEAQQQAKAPQQTDRTTFREAFEAAAMKRDRRTMVALMRREFGLTHATAIQSLDDRTGDALQVMMKAEGFDGAQANRIVMLAIPAVGLSQAATARCREIWERLKVETCREAFGSWPRDERTTGVHQPMHSDASGVRTERSQATRTPIAQEIARTG